MFAISTIAAFVFLPSFAVEEIKVSISKNGLFQKQYLILMNVYFYTYFECAD